MLKFLDFLKEKYQALGNPDPRHYTHLADYSFRGAAATGAAANVYKHMQHREDSTSSMEPQKKTDGKVSVVTVRNSKDSPYHNPKYPEHAVGVAYKGRIDAKTIDPKEKVSYSHEDIKSHYGAERHLTPMLSKLLDHAHKVHGTAPIIQHDIHTTTPEKDIHHSNGKATWQPNVVRNSTTDPEEIKKLKGAKIVIASHTAMDKDFTNPRGAEPEVDIKHHPDVYNVNLNAPKVSSKTLQGHNKIIGQHISDKETRDYLDTIAKTTYNKHLEPFVNSKIRTG
jgi:hemin uptake protein HemP